MENYFYLNEKNEQKGPVSPEELIRNGGNEKLPRVEKRYGPMGSRQEKFPNLRNCSRTKPPRLYHPRHSLPHHLNHR